MRIKIYGDFYHGIMHIAYEGCHVKIKYKTRLM